MQDRNLKRLSLKNVFPPLERRDTRAKKASEISVFDKRYYVKETDGYLYNFFADGSHILTIWDASLLGTE